jgi:hypothetical protein
MTFAKLLFTFVMTAAMAASAQAATPAPAQREIDHLLDHLASSGCEFNRNGSWYAGPAARAHLQEKADYLAKRDKLSNAEAFIALAATSSSMSGKAYQVRCPKAAPVPSGVWLNDELKRFRQSSANKSP